MNIRLITILTGHGRQTKEITVPKSVGLIY